MSLFVSWKVQVNLTDLTLFKSVGKNFLERTQPSKLQIPILF